MSKGVLVFDPNDPNSRSRTKQSFAKEADINNIMKRASKTGVLIDPAFVSNRRPYFGDFSDVDFRVNVDRISQVNQAFMCLPAEVRSRFANDPGLLLDFVADSKNADEARKLGLLPPLTPDEIALRNKAYDDLRAAEKAAGQAPVGGATGS